MRTKRTCLTMGLLGADDATLKRRGAKPLEGAWREWNETANYGPRVHLLSLDEMDKVEAERERAARYVVQSRLLQLGSADVLHDQAGKTRQAVGLENWRTTKIVGLPCCIITSLGIPPIFCF